MRNDIKYCQRCGHELGEKLIEDRTRPFCFNCGFIVYLDPKVAAVVVLRMDDKLVFVKRGVEPAIGKWAFPSGYVDRQVFGLGTESDSTGTASLLRD